jgi:predicted deacylase
LNSDFIPVEPDFLQIEGWRLPVFHFGRGDRLGVIVAGVHGWEHASVWTAYSLIQQLSYLQVRGRIVVVPVANPPAFAGESRLTPQDGGNLGSAFGEQPPGGLTGSLAEALRKLTLNAELVLDLHSAGEARYLPHVIYWREKDARLAAAGGLPFVIFRTTTREGSSDTLGQSLRADQTGLVIECGGGLVAWQEDVQTSLMGVRRLLAKQGFLSAPGLDILPPTPPERVFTADQRRLLKAETEGAFYPQVELEDRVQSGETLGWWLPLGSLQPQLFLNPEYGLVIYLRTRNRVHPGQTVAALIV